MKSKNYCKGVDIHIIDAPKFKTNLISVYLDIPFCRDTVTKAALLPSVLKRGCKAYPTLKDMSRRLDDLYSASFSAGVRPKGDNEVLYFTSEYISDRYAGEKLTAQIVEFMRDFIFSPLTENNGFLKKYVDSEKVNLRNTILGLINDKKEYAEVKCREAMFGKNGYGMNCAGYEEDLEEITPQNLYEYYRSVLNNAKIEIFISGTVDKDSLDAVEKTLVSEFSPRDAQGVKSEIAMPLGRKINKVVEDADAVQSKLCMGLRCGVEPVSDEYYALILANCIFGGSPFSKLFSNVREKLSLAYYVSSSVSRFKSVMMISSGIQTENYQAAYDEITIQFNKMINNDFTDDEITASKKYLCNSLNSMTDSLRRTEDYYLSQIIIGSNQSLDELIAGIMKVDRAQICAVFKKIEFDTVYFLKGKPEAEVQQ